jgi:curli production assembly/transport component CsgE
MSLQWCKTAILMLHPSANAKFNTQPKLGSSLGMRIKLCLKTLCSASRCAVFLFSCWCLTPAPSHAAGDDLLVSGMVLDRTISGFGRDFSYYFSAYWRDLPATAGMTLVIQERVYPQAGTLLWLELNQRRIYQTYLGRRQQDMRMFAEQAVIATIEEIARLQSANMLGADSAELNDFLEVNL